MSSTISSPAIIANHSWISKKRYAQVQWLCPNCQEDFFIHEVAGENYEPKNCPNCNGTGPFIWNSVYEADASGRIIE